LLKKGGTCEKNQAIGILMLFLAVYTIVGMVLKSDDFWLVYNYITLAFFAIGGLVLLKNK